MQSKINGPVNLVLYWNPVAVSPPLLSCTEQRHIFLHFKNIVVIYKYCSKLPLETAAKEVSRVFANVFQFQWRFFS